MRSENEKQVSHSKATFSVPKEVLYPYLKTENQAPERSNKPSIAETVLNTTESIMGINLAAIKQIEKTLKLTFLYEKGEGSTVCMANSPEVRDEFKDVFDIKDVLDYSYAVLHLPSYIEKYKNSSKINSFQVFYPNSPKHFWKFVNLGAKLRDLNLLEDPSVKKNKIEIDEILNKIAEIKVE